MPTQREPQPVRDANDANDLTAAISAHVLANLGRPMDLNRVVVRRLWSKRYRVNVLVGQDVTSTTIAHSYFLEADDDGTVRKTIPVIVRSYGSPAGGGQ